MTATRSSAPPAASGRVPNLAARARAVEHCGAVAAWAPAGRSGGTWLLRAARGAFVLKRLPPTLDAPALCAALAMARAAGVRAVEPCAAFAADAQEYVVFPFVRGEVPRPGTEAWSAAWCAAREVLHALDATAPEVTAALAAGRAALPRTDLHWLRCTGDAPAPPPIAALWARVAAGHTRDAPQRLAHGDFAPQNMLWTSDGLVLLDWEAVGVARRGADAGWLAALNRIGAGPQLTQSDFARWLAPLAIPAEDTRWGEGIGLLRLHWRAARWAVDRPALALIAARVAQAANDYLAEP